MFNARREVFISAIFTVFAYFVALQKAGDDDVGGQSGAAILRVQWVVLVFARVV